jgi:transcriptional regulator with XRE-family HTH domain
MSKMREIRKGHSMTLAELSFRAGVQETWLSNAERGWKKFSETAQGKIAAVLGVDREELFDDAGRAKN